MYEEFEAYGRKGVDALAAATPRDTGLASHSWGYQIGDTGNSNVIYWFNTDREGGAYGVNVALILQYGHGTGTGGYVEGRDYINPAMRPIFDRIVEDVWKKVRDA